jgi:hypothetical protein
MRKALDESGPDRVNPVNHYDRYGRRCLPGRDNSLIDAGEDDVDLETHQFRGGWAHEFRVAVR